MFDQFDSIAGEQWANQSLRGGARNKSISILISIFFSFFLLFALQHGKLISEQSYQSLHVQEKTKPILYLLDTISNDTNATSEEAA